MMVMVMVMGKVMVIWFDTFTLSPFTLSQLLVWSGLVWSGLVYPDGQDLCVLSVWRRTRPMRLVHPRRTRPVGLGLVIHHHCHRHHNRHYHNHRHHYHHHHPVIDERPKSPIKKRKRNLIFSSPILRRERETWNSFPQFREEKEKFEKVFFTFEKWKRKGFSFLKFREEKENFLKVSNFEKRKRNLKFFSPVLRREREIWKRVLHFREEKEKWILFSQDSRGEREFLPGFLKKKSLSAKLCQSYCDSQSFRESESLLCQECDFSSNAMHKSWQLLLHVRASPRLETTLLKYFPKCCSFCCYWSLGWWFVYLHCKS